MTPRPLVIISTRLPPEMCGIGSYSLRARQHWHEEPHVEFVVVEGATAGDDGVTEFNSDPAKFGAALDRIGAVDALLHYAGRAYHHLGYPIWMPRVLRRWKAKFPAARLTVFFHELPGAPPIWSRHFLPERINRDIVRKLCALADAIATNSEDHAARLLELTRGREIAQIPIASNIEQVADISSSRARGEFVVFGLPFGRLQTLQLFDPEIRGWIASGRLDQLHLIGPTDSKFSAEADALIAKWPSQNVVHHGTLDARDVSHSLARAEFALTNVTGRTWSKSSAFTACASHQCAVVMKEARPKSEPLCFTFTGDEIATVAPAEIALRTVALRRWYTENADWAVTAGRLLALVRGHSL